MNNHSNRIRVLCVDDHPIVRQGIATLLSVEEDMQLVAEAADGREAVQQYRMHRPDVTLMDLQMPGAGGIDAIATIRAEFPEARIIVLTTYAGDEQARRAMQAGAEGYLLKNALHRELLDAIRRVNRGAVALPSIESLSLAGQVTDESLAPAQIEILRAIVQTHAYADIGQALDLDEHTVASQVQALLARFDTSQSGPGNATDDAPGALPEDFAGDRAAPPRLRSSSRVRDERLALITHELRTPLNAVLGYTQLLVMEGGLSERQQHRLTTIHESGNHLLALVNDILDLACHEAGHMRLDPVPTDVPALLRRVVDLMRVKAQEKRLRMDLVVSQAFCGKVNVDPQRLRQVLFNLLGNAIKFTEEGGIVVRADVEPLTGAALVLRIEVEDTGVGLSESDCVRVFEAFQQAGDRRLRSAGTGLGLTVTRALVTDMKGRIRVRSEIGVGTSFQVELPLTWSMGAHGAPDAG